MIDSHIITAWSSAVRAADEEGLSALWSELAPAFQQLGVQWAERAMDRIDGDNTSPSRIAMLVGRIQRNELTLRGSDDIWRLVAAATLNRTQAESVVIESSVDLAAQMTRYGRALLDELADPALESVALFKLAGETNEEIAGRMDRTRRTIQRMIKLIRDIWLSQIEL